MRGERRNELIMKALQFESETWIWEGIRDMLKAIKSKCAKVVRTQQPTTVDAPEEEEMMKSRRRTRYCLIGNYE